MRPIIYTSENSSKTHPIHFNASVHDHHLFSVHMSAAEAIEAGVALIKEAEKLTAASRAEARAAELFARVLAMFAGWRAPVAVAEAA